MRIFWNENCDREWVLNWNELFIDKMKRKNVQITRRLTETERTTPKATTPFREEAYKTKQQTNQKRKEQYSFKLFPKHFVRRKRAKEFSKKNISKAKLISDLNRDFLEVSCAQIQVSALSSKSDSQSYQTALFFLCPTRRWNFLGVLRAIPQSFPLKRRVSLHLILHSA